MTFKDRTSEFNSVVQGVKQRGSAPSTVGGANTRKTQKQHEKSQFFVFASQIGRDITETAEKLDRLTKCKYRKRLVNLLSSAVTCNVGIISLKVLPT
jgi:hypothetical protein